jgi:hypothetical protein
MKEVSVPTDLPGIELCQTKVRLKNSKLENCSPILILYQQMRETFNWFCPEDTPEAPPQTPQSSKHRGAVEARMEGPSPVTVLVYPAHDDYRTQEQEPSCTTHSSFEGASPNKKRSLKLDTSTVQNSLQYDDECCPRKLSFSEAGPISKRPCLQAASV